MTLVELGAFRTDFLTDHSSSISNSQTRIADYLPTSGRVVQHLADIKGKQLGDPDLGAQAIVKVVEAENPPLHLVIGVNALERTRAKIQSLTKNLMSGKMCLKVRILKIWKRIRSDKYDRKG